MNLKEKIAQLTAERDAQQEAETRAHKRKLELNALIKKLHFALRDVQEILVDEPETSAETLQDISKNI